MAVAEFPSRTIALPRQSGAGSARFAGVGFAAWPPLVVVLLGIASLFYLAQTSDLANTGYSIQGLRAEQDNWRMRNEQLSLELSKAKALSVIQAQATTRLLMVPATNVVFLKTASQSGGVRSDPSSRGDPRNIPALEKTTTSASDPLDPVRSSLTSFLAPITPPDQR
jgi:hypothetical protein